MNVNATALDEGKDTIGPINDALAAGLARHEGLTHTPTTASNKRGYVQEDIQSVVTIVWISPSEGEAEGPANPVMAGGLLQLRRVHRM